MIISTTILALTGLFEGGGNPATYCYSHATKRRRGFENCLKKPTGALKRLAGKAFNVLPTIIGNVVAVTILIIF